MHSFSRTTARRSKTFVTICAATLILAGCGGQKTPGSGGGGGGGGNPNPGTGKPPAAGTPQKVHLIWQSGTWMVSLNGGPPVKPDAAKTSLLASTGPTKFEVDIQGPNPPPFKDAGALDVWEGVNAKGQPQTGINSTQILGPTFSRDGKKLIFWDLNEGAPVTINYQINFNSGPSVDPIVDNGGGNWP